MKKKKHPIKAVELLLFQSTKGSPSECCFPFGDWQHLTEKDIYIYIFKTEKEGTELTYIV